MVFVCLSHFGFEYFRRFEELPENQIIRIVTMIASPTFMLISGMMLGLLYHTRPKGFSDAARALAGRGIFLLTVGHALILISCIPRAGGLSAAISRGFITDAIGVAIIVGPQVIRWLSRRERLALALLLYCVGMLMALAWHPDGGYADSVRYLLGGPGIGDPRFNFPLLQWVAVYLGGTIIGEWMGRQYLSGAAPRVERGLIQLGILGVSAGLLIKVGYLALRSSGVLERAVDATYVLTTPLSKLPPSPAYLLFFGGLGLIMTGGLLAANRIGRLGRLIDWLSDLGRASLFAFLLQFYVYYLGFYYLRLPYSLAWPIYFAVSLFLIMLASRWWLARGWNRVFDVTRWFSGRKTPDRATDALA